MRFSLSIWSLTLFLIACGSKPSVPMFAGDCAALRTKLASLTGLSPDTASAAEAMCARHDFSQADADCVLKATNAPEAAFCVTEALKDSKLRSEHR